MELEYLIFDFTDEDGGDGSFDAMAAVLADRLPALAAEVEAVLHWAHQRFGAPAGAEGLGEWDFELQGSTEAGAPWALAYDPATGTVSCDPARGRMELTLTLSGSRGFCEAFGAAFSVLDA